MSGGLTAILCSGQGNQHREMFAWLGDVPEAAAVFAAAAPFLDGVDPRRFVRDAEERALFDNRAGQILCCTQALAAWAMLGDKRPRRIVLAGYSVGELAAWGCAGHFTPRQVLALASERADLMDREAPEDAGLAAVIGIRRSTLDRVLQESGACLAISNDEDNAVIGGTGQALDQALAAAKAHGATTARRLRVSVPSHTPLLRAAGTAFGQALERQARHAPCEGVRLLSGIDAGTVRDPAAGLRKLAAQIGQTIDWGACLRACLELGAETFLELGPGTALGRMAEGLTGGLRSRSVDQFRSAAGVRTWLTSA